MRLRAFLSKHHFGAVEKVPAEQKLEFIDSNGKVYITVGTVALVQSLGLMPTNMLIYSLHSNGMACHIARAS